VFERSGDVLTFALLQLGGGDQGRAGGGVRAREAGIGPGQIQRQPLARVRAVQLGMLSAPSTA